MQPAVGFHKDTPFHAVELACTADIVSAQEALRRIQEIVLQFLTHLSREEPSVMDLSLLCRTAENCHSRPAFFGGDDSLFLSHSSSSRPFVKKQCSKSFVRVWMVLRICHQLLEEGKQATQREFYYRLSSEAPNYFQRQSQVNDTILDVVALVKCSRNSLGVLASSKGAVVGRLLIQEPMGTCLNCANMGTSGQVIPGDLKCIQNWRFQSDARYIVLVEKDTVFQRLLEDRFFHLVPCIIITARGYPDLASRVFLHRLRCLFPLLPIVALVDWNPAGLAIVCTYKFGSIRMGLEASNYVCDVKWLGLRSGDLQYVPSESLLPLTAKDKRLGTSLLSSKMLQGNHEYQTELSAMLDHGHRAEIESLHMHGYTFLGRFLAQKIMQRDYI